MIALGIDVSTTKIAVGCLNEQGDVDHAVGPVGTRLRGARRLVEVRATTAALMQQFEDPAIVMVEVPWGSFVLLAVAGVVLEATQATLPDAVVVERQTTSWKLESVGRGNATKGEVMGHAKGLGYEGEDQDVADATCMAQAAWAEWWRMEGRAA